MWEPASVGIRRPSARSNIQSLRSATNKMLFVMLDATLLPQTEAYFSCFVVASLHLMLLLHHHVIEVAAAVSVSWSKASLRLFRERLRPNSVCVGNTKSFSLAHNQIRLQTRRKQCEQRQDNNGNHIPRSERR